MRSFLVGACLLTLSGAAVAQPDMDHHAHHAAAASHAKQDDVLPASTRAFLEVNDKMHADMNIEFTGNADVDFVRGMIPHHVGAVDMAKVVLEHGSDPDIRKLAEAVVAAQEDEIQMMQGWLERNGAADHADHH